jgi:iron complex outermembrane receptor protein
MALVPCAPSLAAVEDAGPREALEEIIVTAERRAQSVQDVPAAVTAIGGALLEEEGIQRTAELASRVPGLELNRVRLGETRTLIRGIGGSAQDNIGANQPVAMFVDGVYVSRGAAMDMALFDLDRVEVLRGPQGTLYGKNAVAGTISVYTKPPSDELRARARVDVGEYDTINSRFLLGGPLADTLSGKIVVGNNYNEGFTKNLTTGEHLSGVETYFGRAALRHDGDSWTLNASIDVEHNPEQPGQAIHIVGSTGLEPLGFGPFFSPSDPFEVTNDVDNRSSQDVWGAVFDARHSATDVEFQAITGYRATENEFLRDIDNSDSTVTGISIVQGANEDSWMASQELRLSSTEDGRFSMGGRLFWTSGLYLFHEEGYRAEDTALNLVPGPQHLRFDLDADSVAAYGQATYSLNDRLRLTGGLRYTWEQKEAVHNSSGVPILADLYSDVSIDDDWSEATPKVTLDFDLMDDVLAYATYARGFQSGGFNFGPATEELARTDSFDPEQADNFELGLKSRLLEGRMTLNVAAYYIDYTDIQVQALNTATGGTITENAAEATSQGLELEAVVQLLDGLTARLNYAYTDATYDTYCDGGVPDLSGDACVASGGVDYSGNRLQYSARNSGSLALDYEWAAWGGRMLASASISHRDRHYFTPENLSVQSENGYTILNGRLDWQTDDDVWGVSLWGRNITDEEYLTECLQFGGTSDGAACMYAPPRVVGISLTYNR